jgi:hypothetical protein
MFTARGWTASLGVALATEFFLAAVPAQITFAPDASGTVTEFALEQNGRKPHALRVEKP